MCAGLELADARRRRTQVPLATRVDGAVDDVGVEAARRACAMRTRHVRDAVDDAVDDVLIEPGARRATAASVPRTNDRLVDLVDVVLVETRRYGAPPASSLKRIGPISAAVVHERTRAGCRPARPPTEIAIEAELERRARRRGARAPCATGDRAVRRAPGASQCVEDGGMPTNRSQRVRHAEAAGQRPRRSAQDARSGDASSTAATRAGARWRRAWSARHSPKKVMKTWRNM